MVDLPLDPPAVESPSLRRRKWVGHGALYLVAFFVLCAIIIPLTFSVLGGFRTNQQLVQDPVGFPNPWTGSNYTSILQSGEFWRQVGNSTVIALLTAAMVLSTGRDSGSITDQ